MTKSVCLVIGAGAGIGGNVAKKFALQGYHSFLCRRSDQEGLNKLVNQITEAGGSASGRLVNAMEDDAIEDMVKDIEADVGPIEVVI
ncbi:MAG: SDR family NAD(P)-dependent oxidoreductase, partial [Gammaproteobacteria bacterium]|nr:SDR family NAD(P)-dependent oxidoreductase [Gammaproteobacteria bacterium]